MFEKENQNRESIIKKLMKENPYIKTQELANHIGVSLRTIKNVLKVYEGTGDIERVNGKRFGYWKVNK